MKNRQYIKTDQLIQTIFLSLWQHAPIANITVHQICNDTDLDRRTFYNHYADIYALKDSLEQQFVDELEKQSDELLKTKGSGKKALTDFVNLEFSYIKTHLSTFKIFVARDAHSFYQKYFHFTYRLIIKAFSNFNSLEIQYVFVLLSWGLMGWLEYWLKQANQEETFETIKSLYGRLLISCYEQIDLNLTTALDVNFKRIAPDGEIDVLSNILKQE
jgi:AcrR family transcriptional regulator